MKRVTLVLDSKTMQILEAIGERYDMTMSEAVRAMVALLVKISQEEIRKDKEHDKGKHNT